MPDTIQRPANSHAESHTPADSLDDAPHEHDGGHHHVPVHYAGGTGRRAAIFVVVLLLGLAAIFAYRFVTHRQQDALLDGQLEKSGNKATTVNVVHARASADEKRLVLPGDARAYYDTTIFARTTGYVKDVNVDIGDAVAEGKTLLTIETPDLDADLLAGKAKRDELNAQVHVAETSLTFAQVSFKRWDESTADGSVSRQERDQKKSELDSAAAKLEAAKAQAAHAEAEVQRLETMEKFKEVKAPFAGVITVRHVDPGDFVAAGGSSNSGPLFNLVKVDKIRVTVEVPQNAAPEIKSKMGAIVTYAGRAFPGTVERTSGSIDRSSRTLRVEVVVPNEDGGLLAGVHVQVALETSRSKPQLQVPASALLFRTKGPQVAVIGPDKHVKIKDVHITRDSGDVVEIDGVSSGEMVALNLSNAVMDGDTVDPRDVDKKKDEAPAKTVTAAAPATHGSDIAVPASSREQVH